MFTIGKIQPIYHVNAPDTLRESWLSSLTKGIEKFFVPRSGTQARLQSTSTANSIQNTGSAVGLILYVLIIGWVFFFLYKKITTK